MDSDAGVDNRRETDHGNARLCAGADTREGHAALHGTGREDQGEEYEIPLKAQGRGTELSQTVPVKSVQFRRTNKDYDLDWHPAPNRQYVVTLSGESEIELEGGRKLRLGPGHILLAEDTTGQGHISRAIGGGDRISLFIPLADGAVPPR